MEGQSVLPRRRTASRFLRHYSEAEVLQNSRSRSWANLSEIPSSGTDGRVIYIQTHFPPIHDNLTSFAFALNAGKAKHVLLVSPFKASNSSPVSYILQRGSRAKSSSPDYSNDPNTTPFTKHRTPDCKGYLDRLSNRRSFRPIFSAS
jgi:hypothetical protein